MDYDFENTCPTCFQYTLPENFIGQECYLAQNLYLVVVKNEQVTLIGCKNCLSKFLHQNRLRILSDTKYREKRVVDFKPEGFFSQSNFKKMMRHLLKV